jgi:hypothetical protein
MNLTVSGVAAISISNIEPTVFFPKVKSKGRLKQIAELSLKNPKGDTKAKIKIAIKGMGSYTEDLDVVKSGESIKEIHILDISKPSEISFELYEQGNIEPVDSRIMTWQPQRKWKIYDVAFCHQDLGYEDYYHMMRRDVREWGIELAMEYCTLTDDWDEDSKYRWTVETSEPIIGYIQNHSKADVDELVRRIKEGRIELGAIHNTASTEAMSYELLARLFYTPNRHVRDLLDIETRKTALINDVVGLTRSLPLYTKEAGLPYFFHGRNRMCDEMQTASAEPVFFWQPQDGDRKDMTLFRTERYNSPHRFNECNRKRIQSVIEVFQDGKWPYDSILTTYSLDYLLPRMDKVTSIREWNAKWDYPRIICATMTMFFDSIASQIDPGEVFTFDKDVPNAWADMEITDCKLTGQARKLGYMLPMVEKFCTIATALGGDGYPWLDIWHAYNRLLMYHEHTNGASNRGTINAPKYLKDKTGIKPAYYETEKNMHRGLVSEAQDFAEKAGRNALSKLERMVTTNADETLIVFNPLNWKRTDIVRFQKEDRAGTFHVVDNVTRNHIACQDMPDGTTVFVADDVPPLGYKTFSIVEGEIESSSKTSGIEVTDKTLENQFYRIAFDPKRGTIKSIYDKDLRMELVDQSAVYCFNEYLYQHYECDDYSNPPAWHRIGNMRLSSAVGPVAGVMTTTMADEVPEVGAKSIKQTVIIYSDIKRIDFVQNIDKAPSGRLLADYYSRRNSRGKEGVFYALPFAIEQFQIKHELPGAVIEPIAEQSVGSITDYYAIQHFADISNSRYGVTLATVEAPLVEYGKPRSAPWNWGSKTLFNSILQKPNNSHMYLYLMSNIFFTNICIDQPGPKTFTWSIRSHKGGWKQGKAYKFGWDISNPLITSVARGSRHGLLPAECYSFVVTDKSNVVCSTIKFAEANGSGIILRFHELAGEETTVVASLPFLRKITSANETNLIENDKPIGLKVLGTNTITFAIRPHGIKTIRIQSRSTYEMPKVAITDCRAVSDMAVEVSWQIDCEKAKDISHYSIYRSTSPDFGASILNLAGWSTKTSFSDRPKLNYGGWLDNKLEPQTTYYYRISPVDRWNNQGLLSDYVKVTTLEASSQNAVPSRVEGLYAVHVSPSSQHDFVSLWFYTNCESDVNRYRIYRSTHPDFLPQTANLVAELDAGEFIKHVMPARWTARIVDERPLTEYNRQLYIDETVIPDVTYYYKVCAVDEAGNVGPYSREVRCRIEPRDQ